MIAVLGSWIYIGIFCLAAGSVSLAALEKLTGIEGKLKASGTAVITAGVLAITVCAEYWSIFYKVGVLCHVTLLAAVILCLILWRQARDIYIGILRKAKAGLFSWTGLGCMLMVLLIAFATSRGTFHTDTGIYHAQAIRLIEEYGLIKGMANLQLHFGYNSAYLVFCAFFTLSKVLPVALHTTTGFLAALYTVYACRLLAGNIRRRILIEYTVSDEARIRVVRNKTARKGDEVQTRTLSSKTSDIVDRKTVNGEASVSHRLPVDPCSGTLSYMIDAGAIAILIYVFTNLTGVMSPATDYGTLLVTGYLISSWLEAARRRDAHTNGISITKLADTCNLSVLALFVASMKLSAAFMVLLVVWSLIQGLRVGKGKSLARYVVVGLLVFLPYLVRNVLISGWLFYPVTAMDLFRVPWKVPAAYAIVDSQQIVVWGKCLYDIGKADWKVSQWLPIWWQGQEHYGQMLIYANVLAAALLIINFILHRLVRKSKAGPKGTGEVATLILVLLINEAVWFLTAPFIRYGLVYLLVLPLLAAALFLDNLHALAREKSFWKVPGAFFAVLAVLCFCAWIDHYAMDDLVYVKQNLSSPYYLWQQPFDNPREEAEERNGIKIYYAAEQERNSYYVYPSTAYKMMLDRTELIGNSIEEGFRPAE